MWVCVCGRGGGGLRKGFGGGVPQIMGVPPTPSHLDQTSLSRSAGKWLGSWESRTRRRRPPAPPAPPLPASSRYRRPGPFSPWRLALVGLGVDGTCRAGLARQIWTGLGGGWRPRSRLRNTCPRRPLTSSARVWGLGVLCVSSPRKPQGCASSCASGRITPAHRGAWPTRQAPPTGQPRPILSRSAPWRAGLLGTPGSLLSSFTFLPFGSLPFRFGVWGSLDYLFSSL